MIRCTIDLLPGGDASRARTIGLIEIANVATESKRQDRSDYSFVLKKTPPFKGALHQAWKSSKHARALYEDDEVIQGMVLGHHHTRRGVYDLIYRGLRACGLEKRNGLPVGDIGPPAAALTFPDHACIPTKVAVFDDSHHPDHPDRVRAVDASFENEVKL